MAATNRISLDLDCHITALKARTEDVDRIIKAAWPKALANGCIIATGGYGRALLFPHSDIDVLLIFDGPYQESAVVTFIQTLWDQGLVLSHSVRTYAECLADASDDLSFYSSLLEMRLLAGKVALYHQVEVQVLSEALWGNQAFLQAKLKEQKKRHEKYAHNIQPDIKRCPGGFRDILMVYWLIIKFYKNYHIISLKQERLLTRAEMQQFSAAIRFLCSLRYVLHERSQRAEERLLFDNQKYFAKQYQQSGQTDNQAVERFMQVFYQHTRTVSYVNELVISQLEYLTTTTEDQCRFFSEEPGVYFRNQKVSFTHPELLPSHPELILKALKILHEHQNEVNQLFATAIRAIRQTCAKQTFHYRQHPKCREAFISLISLKPPLGRVFEYMIRYGFFTAYLPEFAATVGQVQFDLFHIHTVDFHTIEVIKYLDRIMQGELVDTLPEAQHAIANLPNWHTLYLAALFHDMGKGQGVDHSLWGESKAREFCLAHDLAENDVDLVAWLVKNHLYFSATAQKSDLADADVIKAFAEHIGSQTRLDYLFLLTIADIRGTNPALWTSWRQTLLQQLYRATTYLLKQCAETKIMHPSLPSQPTPGMKTLWPQLPESYFRRFSKEEQNAHYAILQHVDTIPEMQVKVARNDYNHQCVISMVGRRRPYLFSQMTQTLAHLGLSIAEARIYTHPENQWYLAFFVILQYNGEPITEYSLIHDIEQRLQSVLKTPGDASKKALPKLRSRHLKYFNPKTYIQISPTYNPKRYLIAIKALDRPGLLADIADVLKAHQLQVTHAKVMTIGECVEDVITIEAQGPLSEIQQANLTQNLSIALDTVK